MSLTLSRLLAPPIALLALAPLVVLVFLADGFTTLLSLRNLELLVNTVVLAGLTASGAILVGVPLALFAAYAQLPRMWIWLVLLASPLAVPSYLGAFALYAASGPGGELAASTGLTTPTVEGLMGAALVMTLYTYPFVLLTTRASLLSQDSHQTNAARTLGLTLGQAIWRISLPRARGSIGAGALLAALYAVSDFGTPAIMNFDTFTRLIYLEYNAFGLGQAALLSMQLMVIVGLILYLESRVITARESPSGGPTLALSVSQSLAPIALAVPVLALAVGLPLWVFAVWLVREGVAGFDLQIVMNSGTVSLLAAAAAALAAIPVALVAGDGRWGRIIERTCYFGFGVPGIVMGTALVYLGLQLPSLYQTLTLLVLAYSMRFLPLAVGTIRAVINKLDNSLTGAARLLGATPAEAFRRVTLPLSIRGILAGAALVFLEAMRELPATLLLAPTGFETLSTYLWRVYEAGYFGRAAIPALVLIALSAAGMSLVAAGESQRTKMPRETPN